MAVLTDAQVGAFTNEVWDQEVLQARYGAATIMPRILNKSSLVSDGGEIIHISIKSRLIGGNVGVDGGFTSETATFPEVQVNVNTWKYVSQEFTDKQGKQALVSLESELPSQFGELLAEFGDIDIANLFLGANGYDGINAGVGLGNPGIGVSFLEDTALAAVLALRRRNIPLENLSWLLSPECYYLGWLTKERLTNSNTTGLPESVLTTNFRQKILNIPGYESTLLNGTTATNDAGTSLNAASGVNVAGTTACALINKEFAAYGMQINQKYEKARGTAAGRLTTIMVASSLYGMRVVRSNHGVVIYVKNT